MSYVFQIEHAGARFYQITSQLVSKFSGKLFPVVLLLSLLAIPMPAQTDKQTNNQSTAVASQVTANNPATPQSKADSTSPQQNEVERLRQEVEQLRTELDRVSRLVDDVAKSKSDAATSDSSAVQAQRTQEPAVVNPTQSTANPTNPRVAMATKAQGGDLSGAGNLLRTDRITIGGYGDFQFRESSINERADGGGSPTFQNTRFVLGIAAVLSEKQNIVFNSEIEYEFGSREIDVEQAFVEWKVRPEFAFRGGIFVPAIGRFNVYHDSNLNLATIRPLINQFIVPTAYRDTGVGIRGRFKLPHKMKLTYEFDIVNGLLGENDDEEPTPFSRLLGQSSAAEPGAVAFQDPNRSKAFVGRLGFSPFNGFEFGVSDYTGKFNREGEDPQSVNIFFLDASYRRGPLGINAEYGRSNIVGGGIPRRSPAPPVIDVNDPESIQALADFAAGRSPGQDGFYVEGTYQFRPGFVVKHFDDGGYIAPVIRYEVVRLDRTLKDFYLNRSRTTIGLNIAPSSTVIFKLDYLLNHTFGPAPRVPAGIGEALFGQSPLPHIDYGRNGFSGSIAYVF
ncbi:MAG: hypothetical protein ACRD4L_02520 [Pyrinomonadaceae bacterium]